MNSIKTIGLDLRFLNKNDYYSQFIYELIGDFIKVTPENFYNIYLDLSFSNLNFGENTKNIFPLAKYRSISEQIYLTKLINKDKNDIVLFFKSNKPLIYKGKYIVFIPELSGFHFPGKENIFKKFGNNFLFKNTCKNAYKIVSFNKKTKSDINDQLNIPESKISILNPFFSKIDFSFKEEIKNLTINLETKYNIKGDYFLYSSGIGTEKNLSRLLKVFEKIKKNNILLNLIILDEKTIKDVDFRKQVINTNMVDKIFFIGNIGEYEKDYFYKNSLAIIFPHLYNVFPFSLTKALNYNTSIVSSNLDNMKIIFGDKIDYFNPNNIEDMYNTLIKIKKKTNDFSVIFKKNNIQKSLKDLEIILK